MRKIYLFIVLLFLSLGLLVKNLTASAQSIDLTIFECNTYNYFDVILDENEEYNVKASAKFIVDNEIYKHFDELGTSILFTDYDDNDTRDGDVEYYLSFFIDYDYKTEIFDISIFFAKDSDYNEETYDYDNKYYIYQGIYYLDTDVLETTMHIDYGVYIPDYTGVEDNGFTCEGQMDRYYYCKYGNCEELDEFYTDGIFYTIFSCIYARNYKSYDTIDDNNDNDYYYLVDIDNLVTIDEILPNITVTDITYGDITDSLRILYTDYDELDTKTVGKYNLILGASDGFGNAVRLNIIVKVCDIVSPTITKSTTSIDVGMSNDEVTENDILSCVDVTDNYEVNDILVDLSNYEENKTTVGTYTVSITAYDAEDNTTTETIDVNVVDNVAPTITANTTYGHFDITFSTQDELTLDMLYLFVSVTDNYDENPTLTLTGYEDIDFEKLMPGNYSLKYTATDSAGNSKTVLFSLHIEDLDYPTFVVSDDIIVLETGLTLTQEEIVEFLSNYTDSTKTIATVASSYFDEEFPTDSYTFTVMYTDSTIEVFTISFTGSDDAIYGNNMVSSTNANSWLIVVASICGIILLASGIFIYKRLKKNR